MDYKRPGTSIGSLINAIFAEVRTAFTGASRNIHGKPHIVFTEVTELSWTIVINRHKHLVILNL